MFKVIQGRSASKHEELSGNDAHIVIRDNSWTSFEVIRSKVKVTKLYSAQRRHGP